jgi:hypothetical protein
LLTVLLARSGRAQTNSLRRKRHHNGATCIDKRSALVTRVSYLTATENPRSVVSACPSTTSVFRDVHYTANRREGAFPPLVRL